MRAFIDSENRFEICEMCSGLGRAGLRGNSGYGFMVKGLWSVFHARVGFGLKENRRESMKQCKNIAFHPLSLDLYKQPNQNIKIKEQEPKTGLPFNSGKKQINRI